MSYTHRCRPSNKSPTDYDLKDDEIAVFLVVFILGVLLRWYVNAINFLNCIVYVYMYVFRRLIGLIDWIHACIHTAFIYTVYIYIYIRWFGYD